MVKIRFKGVRGIPKKLADGTVKIYYYHRATNTRLPDDPTSAKFALEYNKIERPSKAIEGTMGFLIEQYLAGPYFAKLKDNTKTEYRRYCDRIKANGASTFVDEVTTPMVYEMRNEMAATPRAADMMVAVLRILFGVAKELGYRKDNPAEGIRSLRPPTEQVSYEPWPDDVVKAALKAAPQHIATPVMLALHTGQRLSDVLKMTWGDIDDEGVKVKQDKTDERVHVFLHPDLAAYLATLTKRPGRIAANTYGKPWTVDGFKASWSTWKADVDALGGYVFHGLRHTAASKLYEAGCDIEEIMAITGHTTETMVRRYIKRANRKIRARAGIMKLTDARAKNESGS